MNVSKAFGVLKRPLVAVLAAALMLAPVGVIFSPVAPTTTAVALSETVAHAPDNAVKGTRVADPSSMMGYRDNLLNSTETAADARYAGRLWGDKSVFARDSVNEFYEDGVTWTGRTLIVDGQSIITDGDFLTAASLIGSSQAYNIDIPINLTIVIDNSGSMYGNDKSTWSNTRAAITVESVNKAIDRLMMDHPDNEVSVVLFGDGAAAALHDSATTHLWDGNSTAVTILPMKHYTVDADVQRQFEASGDWNTVETNTQYLSAGWSSTGVDPDGDALNHSTGSDSGFIFVNNDICDLNDGDKGIEAGGVNGCGSHKYTAYRNGTTNIQAGLIEGMNEILDAEKTFRFRPETDEVYRIPVLVLLTDGAVTDAVDNWLNPSRDEITQVLNDAIGFVNDFGHPGISFIRHNDVRGTSSDRNNTAWNQLMRVLSTLDGVPADKAESTGNVKFELYASAENKENPGKLEFGHDTYTDHPGTVGVNEDKRESTIVTGGSLAAMQGLAEQYRDDQSYMVLTYLLSAAYYKLAVKNAYHMTSDWNVYTISVDMPDPSSDEFVAGFSGTVGDSKITTNPAMMDPGEYFSKEWLKDIGYSTGDGTIYDEYTVGDEVVRGIEDAVDMWNEWNNGQDVGLKTFRSINGSVAFTGQMSDGITRWAKTKAYTKDDVLYTAAVDADGDGSPTPEQIEKWTTSDQAKAGYDGYAGDVFAAPGHNNYWRVYDECEVDIPSKTDAQSAAEKQDFTFNKLDYDYVTEAYYVSTGASGGATIASAFDKIMEQMTKPLFVPVGGTDAFGASDSVTYIDPIGLYMEVKNDAITVDGKQADIVLTLFGGNHPMEAAAIYRPDGKYLPGDPEKHLSADELIQYLPTLDAEDAKTGSTVYTFYRCQHGADTGEYMDDTEVNNPCYQTDALTASGKHIGRDIPYKISDIRVWTEDTGSYVDEDYSILPGNNFDQVLCMSVPVAAIPM